MFFSRFLVVVNCAVYIAIAVWTIVDPGSLLSSIDVAVLSRAGMIEMQVLIAGSMIAFSGILSAGIFDVKQTKRALVMLFIINGAWFATRIVSFVDGLPEKNTTYMYLGFEFVMLVWIILALRIITVNPARALFSNDE